MTSAIIFDLLARDKSVTDTFRKSSRSAEDAAGKMNSAFAGASKSITSELDKIERAAWESGDGLSAEFSAGLAVVRDDLGRINDVARRTGQGLESELGSALRDVSRAMEQLRPTADDASKAVERAASKMDDAFESAARKIERELDDIKQAAWESGRGMDREFSHAMLGLRSDLDRIRSQAGTTGAHLESELGGALRDVREQAAKLKKELDDVDDSGGGFGDSLTSSLSGGFDVGGMIESLTGGAGGGWAAAGAAIGGSIVAAEWQAFQAYFEKQKLGGIIAAQQGGTAAEARKLGNVAGNAYYNSFAQTIEDGGAALSGVLGQGLVDTSDSQAEIQKLTNMAATSAQVVGEDANEIARAAKQLLVNGLADNAQQALDLVTAASQRGVNAAGDMLDTLEEYPTKFRDLGISGQEALGLISQAMDAGARDSDIAADALKEFSIRAVDGTAATSRGFRTLGLDSQKMADDIAAGGGRARTALDTTLDALRAIEDPVLRNQAAVDLFGTKAEDLGDALYAMDLDTAAQKLDGFAGSTENAAQVIQDTTPPLEKFGKGIEFAANYAINAADAMNGVGASADGFSTKIEKSRGATDAFKSETEKLTDAQGAAKDAVAAIATENDRYVRTLEEVISAQEQLANNYADAERANIGYNEAVAAANAALKENGETIDVTTEKGRNNRDALLDLSDSVWTMVSAMEAQGASTQEVQGFMVGARAQFVAMADDMGYSAAEANALADKLHLVPGDYNANVNANTGDATRKVKDLIDYLRFIESHSWFAKVGAVGSGLPIGHRAGGGPVEKGKGYFVGEEGIEFFMPSQDGTIIPNDALSSSAAAFRPAAGTGAMTGAAPVLVMEWGGGPTDEVGRAIFEYFRSTIKFRHGGSAQIALGQRGVA